MSERPGPQSTAKNRTCSYAAHGRNLSSCSTCRLKKVRCDGASPKCLTCVRLGTECSLPALPPPIVWLDVKTNISEASDVLQAYDAEKHNRRRPLLTEDQRFQETRELLSSTSSRNLEDLLEEVDAVSTSLSQDGSFSTGPFGAFKCSGWLPSETPANTTTPSVRAQDIAEPPSYEETNGLSSPLSLDQGGSIFATDTDYALTQDTLGACESLFLDQPNADFQHSPVTFDMLSMMLQPTGGVMPIHCANDLVDFDLQTVKVLLDHYQKSLITAYVPVQTTSKSPWKSIHLPCVLSTLGEVVLTGDSASKARVALLFAVLATSAYNLDCLGPPSTDKGSQWRVVARRYRNKAKHRIKLALNEISTTRKKEKYKDLLAALLHMVSICVFSGEMQEARCYLLDVEKFINLFGIRKRRKSVKVQMLHSIYLYLRILQDSTYRHGHTAVQPEASHHLSLSRDTEDSSQLISKPLIMWDHLLSTCACEGVCIIHSEVGRSRSSSSESMSMFEQVYSIPASLMKLIAQATSLAHMSEKLRIQGRSKHSDKDAFSTGVKDLEAKICGWQNSYSPPPEAMGDGWCSLQFIEDTPTVVGEDSPRALLAREAMLYHLAAALHSALIIYFYRCVRDLNAITLQHFVSQTIYHLLEHDKWKIECGDPSSNICWPGFVAGCEAFDPVNREKISRWLEQSAQKSGIRMFYVAQEGLAQVWEARTSSGNQNLPWNERTVDV